MSPGVPLSVLAAVVVVVLGRREWRWRALLLVVPGLVVVATTLHTLIQGREALLVLLDAPSIEGATAAMVRIPALEAEGLLAASLAYLALACSELAPREGSERTGLGWAVLGVGAVATAGLAWMWGDAGGTGRVGWQVLAGLGVSTVVAALGAGMALRTADGVARAVTGTYALIAASVVLYIATGQDWLSSGFAGAVDVDGRAVNLAPKAAASAAVLGWLAIASRRAWQQADRFAVELVVGLVTACTAFIFHMPVSFLQERLVAYTQGGHAVVLDRRLIDLPQGQGPALKEHALIVVDGQAFDARTGQPGVPRGGRIVALRPDALATDLQGQERGLVLQPPDQPAHPALRTLAVRPLVWTASGAPLEGTVEELLAVCGDPCVVRLP